MSSDVSLIFISLYIYSHRSGAVWTPSPSKPYGFCGRGAPYLLILLSCVKVEVAVLALIVRTILLGTGPVYDLGYRIYIGRICIPCIYSHVR